MNDLRWSYQILIVVTVGCFATFALLPVSVERWPDVMLNLATEMIGILVTVVFIDSVIRRREERQRRRFRTIALQQLRFPLIQHFLLLFELYKASVERKPDREISGVADLFNADYFTQISYLDFEKPYPVTPPMSWAQWVSAETSRFKNDLERVVDKYAIYLDPDTLDVAERVIGSHFIRQAGFFPTIIGMWKRQGSEIPANLLGGMSVTMREHTTAFYGLVEVYNAEAPDDRKVAFGEHMWSNNASPLIGSGRVADNPADAD